MGLLYYERLAIRHVYSINLHETVVCTYSHMSQRQWWFGHGWAIISHTQHYQDMDERSYPTHNIIRTWMSEHIPHTTLSGHGWAIISHTQTLSGHEWASISHTQHNQDMDEWAYPTHNIIRTCMSDHIPHTTLSGHGWASISHTEIIRAWMSEHIPHTTLSGHGWASIFHTQHYQDMNERLYPTLNIVHAVIYVHPCQ